MPGNNLASSFNIATSSPFGVGGLNLQQSVSTPTSGIRHPVVAMSPVSLYIKNLPPEADKLFLYEHFAPHGPVLSVRILNDEQTGKCRGVGFVNYADPTSALAAIQTMHGLRVGDKMLHVSLQTQRARST
jgi:RNA recognition motif-containing protein